MLLHTVTHVVDWSIYLTVSGVSCVLYGYGHHTEMSCSPYFFISSVPIICLSLFAIWIVTLCKYSDEFMVLLFIYCTLLFTDPEQCLYSCFFHMLIKHLTVIHYRTYLAFQSHVVTCFCTFVLHRNLLVFATFSVQKKRYK